MPQPTAGSGRAAWGIEALSVSHKATALVSLEVRRGHSGGGFVDAVPKARPEYSRGARPRRIYDLKMYNLRLGSQTIEKLRLWQHFA